MKIFNINIKPLTLMLSAALFGAGVFTSCSEWDDHYEGTSVDGSNTSIWEQISSRPELSDFAEVLTKTKVFRQHKKTETSYADVLKAGQSFTVFAPVNGTFDKANILKLVETAAGDSAVERFFIMNHLTRSPKSAIDSNLRLLNNKRIEMTSENVNGIGIKEGNVRCDNGILHVINSELPYNYTIYEALTHRDDLLKIGDQLLRYNKDEFNENASISSGLVDGIPVYVDSVVYETNILMNAVGQLNEEDSTFYMAVPTNEGWEKLWENTSSYFVYSETMDKRDSLQAWWTNRALLEDGIFSKTIQSSMNDSVISYYYNRNTPEYHVFYKPFADGGIFGNPKEKESCSNGFIYKYDEWPFTPEQTFFKKIELEGEQYWNILEYKSCSYLSRQVNESAVSKGQFLDITPSTGNANWTVTYKLPNALSGTYDVCVVVLPITYVDQRAIEYKPNRFNAEINYVDIDGSVKTFNCNKTNFESNKTKIDTIVVAENFKFPTTNYQQTNDNFNVKLTCNIGSRDNSKYQRRFLLDCIYLRPKRN